MILTKYTKKYTLLSGGRFDELIGNPVKFSETPVTYRHPPPSCGEHSDEILNEIMSKKDNNEIK